MHFLVEAVIKIFKAVDGLETKFDHVVELLATVALWSIIDIAVATIVVYTLN
jgi:hypothetical protein